MNSSPRDFEGAPTPRDLGATLTTTAVAPESALSANTVATAVYEAIRQCAITLRPDVVDALSQARDIETNPRGKRVLEQILENAAIAQGDGVPLCQDTGSVWICLELGEDLVVPGNLLSQVNDAVARAYRDGGLRMSIVRDALIDRTNTQTNTPAFTEVQFRPGNGATLHLMLKGGGSDNASRVVMLPPGAGIEGIRQNVLACVKEKAANACPPLVIGLGVGGTFDKVAGLAKHALLRDVGERSPEPAIAALEDELLEAVNSLGIGPGALGGNTTALSVAIETAPCHIAALPLAINLGCCAMRSYSIDLIPWTSRSAS